MTTYLITDTDGYAITDGLQAHEIEQIAQRIADERGEVVTVTPYHREDGERVDHDDDAYTVEPTAVAE